MRHDSHAPLPAVYKVIKFRAVITDTPTRSWWTQDRARQRSACLRVPAFASGTAGYAALPSITKSVGRALVEANTDGGACVIVGTGAGTWGVCLPGVAFLAGLRELCTRAGAVLIFDEVMTGFRMHLEEHNNVRCGAGSYDHGQGGGGWITRWRLRWT